MRLSNIVGSGFIAKSFAKKNFFFKKKNCILYAAGVSNSLNKDLSLFNKDFKKLKSYRNLSNSFKVIYISSCSVLDKSRNQSVYLKKKIQNENYIKKNFKNYLIVRLPEIIGKNKNKNTLVNFFYNKIKKNEKIILFKNAKRNFIFINDIINILCEIIEQKISNEVINIASSRMTKVEEIIIIFEKILKKKGKILIKKKINKDFHISTKKVKNLKSYKNIQFNNNYLVSKLKTYLKY